METQEPASDFFFGSPGKWHLFVWIANRDDPEFYQAQYLAELGRTMSLYPYFQQLCSYGMLRRGRWGRTAARRYWIRTEHPYWDWIREYPRYQEEAKDFGRVPMYLELSLRLLARYGYAPVADLRADLISLGAKPRTIEAVMRVAAEEDLVTAVGTGGRHCVALTRNGWARISKGE